MTDNEHDILPDEGLPQDEYGDGSDVLSGYAERLKLMDEDWDDPSKLMERVYELWRRWADFHLEIVSPEFLPHSPVVIEPATISGTNEKEPVYPIVDYGNRLSTSKALDMYSAGMSMYKMYMTIEKIIALLVEKMKERGITDDEVQVSFQGFDLCERKAFESIINLPYNVVVTNFDPGVWGENFLKNIKVMAEKGYGYPPEAPRDSYKKPYTAPATGMKN